MKQKRPETAKARRARRTGRPVGDRLGSKPKTTRSRGERADLLTRIKPHEAAAILRVLLKRHSELHSEAEAIAKAMVTDVQVEDVAEAVEQAVLGLDLDDLGARAGRHSWGYVEPTEAAWELLEEELNPFLDDMKRHIELGLEGAAVAMCQGIVLGLYRVQGKDPDQVLGSNLSVSVGSSIRYIPPADGAAAQSRLPHPLVMSEHMEPAGGAPGDYMAYRMSYRSKGGWWPLSAGKLGKLVKDYVRHIRTDEFFELL